MPLIQWVHELFEKSFTKNKIQHEKCSQILNPVDVSILEQVLCNASLNKLLDTLLPIQFKENMLSQDLRCSKIHCAKH
jgi:hypothetical protein